MKHPGPALRSSGPSRLLHPAAGTILGAMALAGCIDPFATVDAVTPIGGGSGPRYVSAFAGSQHSCAIGSGGRALCWGRNLGGALGDGTRTDRGRPGQVQGPHSFQTLGVRNHSCGVTTNGVALCWGANAVGRLGDGTDDSRSVPTAVNTSLRFSVITTGGIHTCALSTNGGTYCWGDNRSDQLGNPVFPESFIPVLVDGGHRFHAISAGESFTCGLDHVDRALCWGGAFGRTPVFLPIEEPFTTLSVGDEHACALTLEGIAYCWGENVEGQLGDGSTVSRSLDQPPVAVATELRFTAIGAGADHTCAIETNGTAYCWGSDRLGQLGDGDPPGGAADAERKLSPTRVQISRILASITAGRWRTCAVTSGQEAYCWGLGPGNSSGASSSIPVLLSG